MDKKIKKAQEWYKQNRALYEKYCEEIVAILREIFEDNKVTYIDITSRAKTVESFTEKCSKDKYADPISEIQDLSGIRITTYTNSEVDKIAQIITKEFVVDEKNSVDKKKEIDVDRFGYLSVHFIASLNDDYTKIHKYKKFANMKFEIQIRTLLQHVWSEIEHDRNYKFKGALPKALKRRFYMIAGVLELVDKEFDLLTEDITNYSNDVEKRISIGDFNIELSNASINALLQYVFNNTELQGNCTDVLINEMKKFGIKTLLDFKVLIEQIDKSLLLVEVSNFWKEGSLIGLIRDLMILNDADKYFSLWDDNWSFSSEDIEYFSNFGLNLEEIADKYDIEIDYDEEYEEEEEDEEEDEDEDEEEDIEEERQMTTSN